MSIFLYTACPITVAYGDGVGPEIMEATLRVLREAQAQLNIETIEIGQRIYDMESHSGILPSAWETLHRNKILLQAPIAQPEERAPIHAELCHRLNIIDGERFSVSPDCIADVHLGEQFALFTPGHGTQPEQAGKNTASPASMILASCMMLSQLGQDAVAGRIWRALALTLESGQAFGTREFSEFLCEHLWANN